MNQVSIQAGTLRGVWVMPPSKSYAQRAIAASVMAKGSSILHQTGESEDEQAALRMATQLGARVELINEARYKIDPPKKMSASVKLDCGESGLGLRLFTPLALALCDEVFVDAKPAMQNRPQQFMLSALQRMGVISLPNSNHFMHLKHKIKPDDILLDGSFSSQFITGVLTAYAGLGAQDIHVRLKNLYSEPYVNMTLQLLKQFGSRLQQLDKFHYYFPADNGPLIGQEYWVEGDWSNAALAMVGAAVTGGEVLFKGLNPDSLQGDKIILEVLNGAGAQISESSIGITIQAQSLKAFQFDATHYPDLFPPLAVLAAHAKGTSCITGVQRLWGKESNRASSLQQELSKFGVTITIQNQDMYITRLQTIENKVVCQAHNDHRIAMACTIMALSHQAGTVISGADAVNKSYPMFYEDLGKLGVAINFKL